MSPVTAATDETSSGDQRASAGAGGLRARTSAALDAACDRLLHNRSLRRVFAAAVHVGLWSAALPLALILRFDGQIPPLWQHYGARLALLIGCRVACFLVFGLFRGLWRHFSLHDALRVLIATSASSILFIALRFGISPWPPMPRSVLVGEWLISLALVAGARLAIRALREWGPLSKLAARTLVVGGGDAAVSVLRDLRLLRDPGYRVVGLLDDDAHAHGDVLHGVRVVGGCDEATLRAQVVKRAVKVVIFTDSFDPERTRKLARACLSLGALPRLLPALGSRLEDRGPSSGLREIAIEDLLGREPVQLEVGQVESLLRRRTVLVTGAAGSIGSELCRQALRFGPARLLLFDTNENGLFFLERELAADFPGIELHLLVGDVGDERRVEDVFRRLRPEVVLHAAAHKHVPMMEANPCQAVKNNVFGTQVLADAADRYEAKAFVLISTDKAVRPTSVMGATKRAAEMVVQRQAHGSKTRFVAVRFGNVLGSAGSVVPIFKEQLAKGLPLTITDLEMTRYFMTIPESAQLVLQAAALGSTGDVYLLDMGKPVKIVDLARDLIELSGLRPGVDVEIKVTGLRPGEKLHEELLLEDEAFDHTPHPKIKVGRIQLPPRVVLIAALRTLETAVAFGDEALVRRALGELVLDANLKQLPAGQPERELGRARLKAV